MALCGGETTDASEFNSLDSLARVWEERVLALDVPRVAETLQLIYRTQPDRPHREKSKGKSKENAIDVKMSQEELDLARAIEESLKSSMATCDAATGGEHQPEIATVKNADNINTGPPEPDEGPADMLTAGQPEIPEEFAEDPDLFLAFLHSPFCLRQNRIRTTARSLVSISGVYANAWN